MNPVLVDNRAFAIGDIHGCAGTFRKMVEEKIQLQKADQLFLLGDYIDRGADSKGVIDYILELREQGYQVHTIRGNHDEMMMVSESGRNSYLQWVYNGGMETLNSFQVVSYDDLDSKYKDFFSNTRYFIEFEKYILVHAGLNFSKKDPLEDTQSMMWIREFKVKTDWLGERVIVHGHTPVPYETIKKQGGEKVINIDGGCVYPTLTGLGNLVALNLRTREFLALENSD